MCTLFSFLYFFLKWITSILVSPIEWHIFPHCSAVTSLIDHKCGSLSGFSVLYWQSTCTLMSTYAPMFVCPPMPSLAPMSHTILITTDVWYCLHTSFFFRSGMVILSYVLYNNLSRPHRWPSGKESAYQYRRYKRHRFDPWVKKVPWSRKQQPTLVFLPGKSHRQRNLVGYSPWGRKCVGYNWTHMHRSIFFF